MTMLSSGNPGQRAAAASTLLHFQMSHSVLAFPTSPLVTCKGSTFSPLDVTFCDMQKTTSSLLGVTFCDIQRTTFSLADVTFCSSPLYVTFCDMQRINWLNSLQNSTIIYAMYAVYTCSRDFKDRKLSRLDDEIL